MLTVLIVSLVPVIINLIATQNIFDLITATMMAGMPGFEHAVRLHQENPDLCIGVHLTLTAGQSVGGVYKTITDETGKFLHLTEIEQRAKAGEIDTSEVEHEYEAQIDKIRAAGIHFDHFDSHHHTHNLPGNVDVFLKLAKKYDVAVRIYDQSKLSDEYAHLKTTQVFADTFFGEKATLAHLQEICSERKAESIEVMCHPAYVDAFLMQSSSYNLQRASEMQILTSASLKEFLQENSIAVCAFADL